MLRLTEVFLPAAMSTASAHTVAKEPKRADVAGTNLEMIVADPTRCARGASFR